MKNIYLICNFNGDIIDVTSASSFDIVHDKYVASNTGEFIVEITKHDLNKILKEANKIIKNKKYERR
jgi:S-adenosylhomocysteine hydrolase